MDYVSSRKAACRIKSYTFRNNRIVQLENEKIRVSVIISKGCDICEFVWKKLDLDLLWQAPGGYLNPAMHIPTCASRLGNNLDYYGGGWHESLPGGGPYVDNGLEEGLHGEVSLQPWQWRVLEDTADCVSIECWVTTVRAPLEVKKRLTVRTGDPTLYISENLLNNGFEPFPFMWGQHPVFGEPFLDEGCILEIPSDEFTASSTFITGHNIVPPGSRGSWPVTQTPGGSVDLHILPPKNQKEADILFLTNLREGRYTIINPKLGLFAGMQWDLAVFDCIWYWKVLHGSFGYPWFGRAYCVGLEIWNGTDYGAMRADGTLKRLGAGETLETEFSFFVGEQTL